MRRHDSGTCGGLRNLDAHRHWHCGRKPQYVTRVAEYRHTEQQRTDGNQIDMLLNQTGTSLLSSTTRPSNR